MAKKLFLVIFAIFFSLSVSAMAETGVTDSEVKVGSFMAKTGPVSFIGKPFEKGMVAYFNWVNKNGGVNGRQINFLAADDQFNPAKTITEVKRLVEQDNVFAVAGGLGTPGCLAVQKYLNDKKVPFVYQGSGSPQFAIPPKKYVFSVQPSYPVEGGIMASYLAEKKGFKRIAVVYRSDELGLEGRNGVVDGLKRFGLELVADIKVKPTDQNFAAQIPKLIASKPEAVVISMMMPQSVNFLKQAKQYGMKKQLFLANYTNPVPQFIAMSKGAATGAQATGWLFAPSLADPNNEATKIYQATYADELPNAYAAAGFIAAEVFTEGLRRTGKDLTRENYVAALETLKDYNGILSPNINYGKHDVNDITCRLGVSSMYVMEAGPQIFSALPDPNKPDWIKFIPAK
jgi:branched-chain amino acid transport system substrate-binding protein